MRQRTHQRQFAWLIFIILNFVTFVVSPLFCFALYIALSAVKFFSFLNLEFILLRG
jgi:hypothetical protein